MPFVEMPGVVGLVYVPEETPADQKKHPCVDCEVCQWCSDSRCDLCRKQSPANSCVTAKRTCRKSRCCRDG